jgi:hypothetical protein
LFETAKRNRTLLLSTSLLLAFESAELTFSNEVEFLPSKSDALQGLQVKLGEALQEVLMVREVSLR